MERLHECAAVRSHPPTGQLVRCGITTGRAHVWHHASAAPLFMHWPAQSLGCCAWTSVSTASGPVVVICALPLADGHDRHEGAIGVFPVRWTGTR